MKIAGQFYLMKLQLIVYMPDEKITVSVWKTDGFFWE